MKNRILITIIFYCLFFFLIFKNIFSLSAIAGGDYITLWPEHLTQLKNTAFSIWDPTGNLGSSTAIVLHEAPYNYLIGSVGSLIGNNVILAERLFWWLPFFIISAFAITFLFKKVFVTNAWYVIAPIIFVF